MKNNVMNEVIVMMVGYVQTMRLCVLQNVDLVSQITVILLVKHHVVEIGI